MLGRMLPALGGCGSSGSPSDMSRPTTRGSDQLPFRTARKPHGSDTTSPGEGGLLGKGKEKEQDFALIHTTERQTVISYDNILYFVKQ